MTTYAQAAAWLAQLRAQHGIDGSYDQTPAWPFRIGGITVPVPNFSWRRAAIQRHDLHHILNGFPFTMHGEFQVATWEFAAGRYPHIGASLLLLPLVALGMLWSPRAIWRAFLQGRRSISLYRAELLPLDLPEIRVLVEKPIARPGAAQLQMSDILAFAGLVLQSAAVILSPMAACMVGFMLL
jgi:hypothetical protein